MSTASMLSPKPLSLACRQLRPLMIRWVGLVCLTLISITGDSLRAEDIVRVGSGSYTTIAPPDTNQPPATVYKTAAVKGAMPTNDWWSSLAWEPLSSAMFPHPLGVKAVAGGLQVSYPGRNMVANTAAIMGGGAVDLVIGHSAVSQFTEARVDGFSDWFVSALFDSDGQQLRTSFGHGSPFVYVTLQGGDPTLTFGEQPRLWSGKSSDAFLGISVANRHYGLFAPSGSSWSGIGEKTWTARTSGKTYFAVALLPDAEPATLALFQKYAYSHVVDTRVSWSYDEAQATVQTEFAFTTKAYEGNEPETLFSLYPHQWLNAKTKLLDQCYNSVRGPMKLGEGTSFVTEMTYPGVLPSLPVVKGAEAELRTLLAADAKHEGHLVGDTYWFGKQLGKWATLLPIAEQLGEKAVVEELTTRIKTSLENFLTATDSKGQAKAAGDGMFFYDQNWGTLIGYPASYGSDDQLNDHHFHYGYFIRAAGEIARRDPAWAADERWGGMVKLLIRDIASTDRDDPLFPFLRNFDPYAGHTWASGHAKFVDGNNNESSSEAINAWYGLILFAEATGDKQLRDLGIWQLTTEVETINHYWYDVTDQFHHADYTPSVVTMVWGGKGANGTWFSGNPEMVHGINWLPLTGGHLYLGRYPEYCEKNYQALVAENLADDVKAKQRDPKGGTNWDAWLDLMWMYRGLTNPQDALTQFHARPADLKPEAGNSFCNTLVWLKTLEAYGQVDRTVTADTPFYAVFQQAGKRTHVAWNLSKAPRTVTFSDGVTVECPPGTVQVK